MYEHQQLFDQVPGYGTAGREKGQLKKPKHAFAQQYSVDIIRNGPMRYNWCMTFEMFNQVIKQIARGSNFKNLCYRILHFWSMKSARDLVTGKTAAWGVTVPSYDGSLQLNSMAQADAAGDEFLLAVFATLLSADTCVNLECEVTSVGAIRHHGDVFVAGESWVVHESLDDDDLTPAISTVTRMVEISGGDHFNVIVLKLCRYSDLVLDLDATVGTVLTISESNLMQSTPTEHFLLLNTQMMTPLQHNRSSEEHRFLIAH